MPEITPLPPEVFRESLRAREGALTVFHQQAKGIQAGYEAALEADFHRAFPRRKWSLSRASLCPTRDAIHAAFQAQADTLHTNHQRQLQEIDATLDALAASTPVWTCEPLGKVLTVWASTYSSQGYGASRYAERHAQMVADKAQYHGLTAEVRPEGPAHSDHRWGITYQDYTIWVNTDEDGWELLKRKPDIPLKEWVRLCWQRQVNPRVYNPWLPPDLEERLGLDHFGNEVNLARPQPPWPANRSRPPRHRSYRMRTGYRLGSAFTPHADAAARHGRTLDWRIRLALGPFGDGAEIRYLPEENQIHVSAQCAPRLAAELEERWRLVVAQFADLRLPVACTSQDYTTDNPPLRWFIGTRLAIARERLAEAETLARHWATLQEEHTAQVHHLVEAIDASAVVCELH